jgi:DNA-binding protein H-NS
MTKNNLVSMSVEALFKLRDDVAQAIADRAADLRKHLSLLTGSKPVRAAKNSAKKKRKGKKVAPQFRSKKDPGLVWSGRGAIPRWMKQEMKGTRLNKESFRIKA